VVLSLTRKGNEKRVGLTGWLESSANSNGTLVSYMALVNLHLSGRLVYRTSKYYLRLQPTVSGWLEYLVTLTLCNLYRQAGTDI